VFFRTVVVLILLLHEMTKSWSPRRVLHCICTVELVCQTMIERSFLTKIHYFVESQ
jgi:hypothetical protein